MSLIPPLPSYQTILAGVFECTSDQLGVPIDQLSEDTRPVEDLGMESLDIIEWMMEVEERFDVTFPEPDVVVDQAYKQVFTRSDFRIGDMVQLVILRWGSGTSGRKVTASPPLVELDRVGFRQLGGRDHSMGSRHDEVGQDVHGHALLRRSADGMPCVSLPGGPTPIGCEAPGAGDDEQPAHTVHLSPFVIDLELVSTTAFCRFLNSTEVTDAETLRRWFFLGPQDRRGPHEVVEQARGGWRPRDGTEEWPMILVSWFGARAYARWAHGHDPLSDDGPSFLPTEAQWEHAVRGSAETRWPWGDEDPPPGLLRAGRGRAVQETGRRPIGPVHAVDGTSAFGLRGALGHVWQWCSDWYAPDAYRGRARGVADPEQTEPSGVRSERGGSWVGPVSLCRPSYRRGRVPIARGQCLGFRCAAPVS